MYGPTEAPATGAPSRKLPSYGNRRPSGRPLRPGAQYGHRVDVTRWLRRFTWTSLGSSPRRSKVLVLALALRGAA